MNNLLTSLGFALCCIACVANAQDLSMTSETHPSTPWSANETVVVSLTITNHADEPRRARIDLDGIDRFHGLVNRLEVLNTEAVTYAHPACVDFSPVLQDLVWCLTTIPIAPGQSLTIDFNVIAFPDAFGFRPADWTAQAESSDFGPVADSARIVVAEMLFAYGIVPHLPVPSTDVYSILAMIATLMWFALATLKKCNFKPGART